MLIDLKEIIVDVWHTSLKEVRECNTFWGALFCFAYNLLGISALICIGLFIIVALLSIIVFVFLHLPITAPIIAFIFIGTWWIRKK